MAGWQSRAWKTETTSIPAASARRAIASYAGRALSRAHGEAFAGISPATHVVAGFIPDVLIEVELDAIVPGTA